jgi:hypothetical protein
VLTVLRIFDSVLIGDHRHAEYDTIGTILHLILLRLTESVICRLRTSSPHRQHLSFPGLNRQSGFLPVDEGV